MSREIKTPGPDHPITVEKNPERVVVRVGDNVVADTHAALSLQESDYPAVQYVLVVESFSSDWSTSASGMYCTAG